MSNAPLFPLLPAIADGFRHLKQDWQFLAALSTFPIFVSFAAMLFLDLTPLGESVLWAGVVKVPADFVKGIFLALYVRYLLFKDTPQTLAENTEGQRAVASSAIVFTALSFLFSGALAFLAVTNQEIGQTPSLALMIGSAVSLVAVLWLFRYQFLPVAAAAGFPARPFLAFLGYGFALPIRIFALWVLTSMPTILILGTLAEILRLLGGFESLSGMQGPAAWLLYLVNAALATLTAAVQTAASVYAIKHGMKGQARDV